MWPIVVLLGWPLLEIALFVVIGGQIGLWATLLWVLLSGAFGVLVLRWVAKRQALALRDLRDPARMAAAGAMGMLGGVLLILPGFFTDTLGLLMLLPPVQALVAKAISARMPVMRTRPTEDVVIDGEYSDVTPRREGPSGWTRIE
jgi:UPF0716 protein FxsA